MKLSDIMGRFYEYIEFFGIIIGGKLYEVVNIEINTGADPVRYRMINDHPHLGLWSNLLLELNDASPEIPERDVLNPLTVYYINYVTLLSLIQKELLLITSDPMLESHSQLGNQSLTKLVLNLDPGTEEYL